MSGGTCSRCGATFDAPACEVGNSGMLCPGCGAAALSAMFGTSPQAPMPAEGAPVAPPVAWRCARCSRGFPSFVYPCEVTPGRGKARETWCNPCWNRSVAERRAARKAQLAAMPRCEFCTRRATYTAGGGVLLCGRHLKAARRAQAREAAGLGNLAFLAGAAPTRDEAIRRWAVQS